jgi:hypothetical protein
VHQLFGVIAFAVPGEAPVVTCESEDAVAKFARTTAKRWLQEPMFADDLVPWSAFALDETGGRLKQTLQVYTVMAAPAQQLACRGLALHMVLLEFHAAGFVWSSSTCGGRRRRSPFCWLSSTEWEGCVK